MERFAKKAVSLLNPILPAPIQAVDLETPPDPEMGDFALPCFKFAKQFGKPPAQIPALFLEKLKQHHGKTTLDGIEFVAEGPFLNMRVSPAESTGALLKDILSGSYGKLDEKSRGRWVLEYSSPNVAKPFLIGHLRSTAIGSALARIGQYRGFDVISINHLGDWGTQYGKLAVAFRRYGDTLPLDPTNEDLVKIYVRFHDEAAKDPTLEDEAREAFVKLEKGDAEMVALWKNCVEISLKGFNQTYARLGVHFDHIWGESYYHDQLDPLTAELKNKKVAVQSEGAWVIPVGDPPLMLVKSDGGTTYAARDLAAAIYRYGKFKFDRMTYVVGGEQKLHFKQVFEALKLAGHTWADRCEHVSFGLYRFQGGKMSTRQGRFVTLEDVLTAAKAEVVRIIESRTEEGTKDRVHNVGDVAEKVALGAVLFFDLSTDPVRDIQFELERVVDFEGETGPYLQYAHTRCLGILRKARDSGELKTEFPVFEAAAVAKLRAKQEIVLVKTLGRFPLFMERSLKFSKINQLANYLVDLTRAYHAFYRECRVLGEEPGLTHARLMLVEATRKVLAKGLGLMGIPLPEQM